MRTKLELARGLLAVLEVVEPGLSKPRAKVSFEVIDTELFLLCQQLRSGHGRGEAAQLKGDGSNILLSILNICGALHCFTCLFDRFRKKTRGSDQHIYRDGSHESFRENDCG